VKRTSGGSRLDCYFCNTTYWYTLDQGPWIPDGRRPWIVL